MIENLRNLTEWIFLSFQWVLSFLISNVFLVVGFVLAVVVFLRIFREQRQPSSIFAWGFFILLVPPVGVPLYFLLGGRKLKKLIKAKGLLTDKKSESGDTPPVRDTFSTEGNQVRFLTDGQVAFATYCRALEEAEKEIHILTYILGNDEVGNTVLDLLLKKASKGVRVRLLVDAFGSLNRPRRKIRKLRATGAEVFTFMPVLPLQTHGWANLRNHRKIAVIDNRVAFLGGRNLDKRFMGKHPDPERFYDFGARYEGPVVEYLNGVFLSDWSFASKQHIGDIDCLPRPQMTSPGESAVTGIASGPDVQGDLLYERLINIIQEFKEELVIVTPYFVPDEVLQRSLIVKARIGKKITLILPERSNWLVVDYVRAHFLRELHAVGVNIQFFRKGMMHGKLMIADNRIMVHGSANFDIRSLFVNFEIGMIHTSVADFEPVFHWLSWLLENSRPFGLPEELRPSIIRS
ncbi:MAG: PLDc N-terminal domain-containing protein, partial [Verrucomicrobiae bacterium]|nr:PLDc N-terminal domain-containing protein [Verrucomicrobiae bacterium]